MVLLYLNQSAHIIDQICESDVKCRPNYPYSSEKQSLHALFHETIDMFDAAACLLCRHTPSRTSIKVDDFFKTSKIQNSEIQKFIKTKN